MYAKPLREGFKENKIINANLIVKDGKGNLIRRCFE